MTLLIAGATGLVGRHVPEKALADPQIDSIVVPGRRGLTFHPKLMSPVVDFDCLPDPAGWCKADAVICTPGTTIREAGTQQAFRQVNHDYPLAVARLRRNTVSRRSS